MYEVQHRELAEQLTLVVRARLAVPDIPGWMGPAFSRVLTEIEAWGSAPAGPPFARFEPSEGQLDVFDIEAGFPVLTPLTTTADDAVHVSTLPSGPAATTLHVGPYDTMTPAYDALEKAVADRGGVVDGPAWANFLTEPDGDPLTWRTEVVQPYRVG